MKRKWRGSAGREGSYVTDPQGVSALVREVVDRIGLDNAVRRVKGGTIGRARTFVSRVTGQKWSPLTISRDSVRALLVLVPNEKHEALMDCLFQPAAQRLLHRYRQWLDEELSRWGLARVRVAVRRDGILELIDGASPQVEKSTLAWEFLHATIHITRNLAEDDEDDEFNPLGALYSSLRLERELREPPFLAGLREKRLLVAWARVLGPLVSKDSSGLVELDWREMKDLKRYVREYAIREEQLLRDWDPVRRIRNGLRSIEEDHRRRLAETKARKARRPLRRPYKDILVTQLDAIMKETLEEGPGPKSPLQTRIDKFRRSESEDAHRNAPTSASTATPVFTPEMLEEELAKIANEFGPSLLPSSVMEEKRLASDKLRILALADSLARAQHVKKSARERLTAAVDPTKTESQGADQLLKSRALATLVAKAEMAESHARKGLEAYAQLEHKRGDGGRSAIKKVLASCGVRNPIKAK